MIDWLSHIGGCLMLFGVILMAMPVIRLASWGYTPIFEVGLGLFLFGLIVALAGAIGLIISIVFSLSLFHYPLAAG